MSYVVSVGGDPINPNPFTYSEISITGNISLVWPSNTADPTYTATNWIDILANGFDYVVTLPDAREAVDGQEIVFNNHGSYDIYINTIDTQTITILEVGETKRLWLAAGGNLVESGIWRVTNIGSGTTQADASALAGYGLVALSGQLSQSMPISSYSTNATINAGNRSYLTKWTGGVGTLLMTSPATLGSNWFFNVSNSGSGTLTIDGNGATIDGSATIQVAPNTGFTVATDGVNFTTVGRQSPATTSFTFLTKSVAGSADVTLTSTEAGYSIIYFTGALTGNINVIVPAAVNQWVMYNNTSGAYTLTVKTASGTGVAITQGTRRILNCDGTNVAYSDTVGTGSVTSIATSTGLSGGPITTSGTILIANTAVTAGTYGSASRAVTYAVNAQGQLTNSTDFPISITDANISAAISVAKGGTGLGTLTSNNVILGNGTSAPQFVAPGTSGNLLTSTGTTWTSSASTSVYRYKVVAYTYDTSTASGTITITGAGFTPVGARITMGGVVEGGRFSVGATDGTTTGCVFRNVSSGGFAENSGMFVVQDSAGVTSVVASFTAFTSDGMTLAAVKLGSPTGNVILLVEFF